MAFGLIQMPAFSTSAIDLFLILTYKETRICHDPSQSVVFFSKVGAVAFFFFVFPELRLCR